MSCLSAYERRKKMISYEFAITTEATDIDAKFYVYMNNGIDKSLIWTRVIPEVEMDELQNTLSKLSHNCIKAFADVADAHETGEAYR